MSRGVISHIRVTRIGRRLGVEVEEVPMLHREALHREIIRTCSHGKVAEAAVASIGGEFCARVELLANASGLDAGAFVARQVRRFADEHCAHDIEALSAATRGSEIPILDGLRWIVEATLDDARRERRARCDRFVRAN